MRQAILTGIHANSVALQAVLAQIDDTKVDDIVVLGDIMGYGADPWDVYAALENRGARMIMGDQEAGVVGQLSPRWFTKMPRQAVSWTQEQLTRPQVERLKRLPGLIHESPAVYVHGSIIEQFEEMVDETDIAQNAMIMRRKYPDCHICFHGQSHQWSLHEAAEDAEVTTHDVTPDLHVELASGRIWMIGVGSVGQPRGGQTVHARWMLFDSETLTLEPRETPYDVNEAIARIRATGQPAYFADRLKTGV